MSILERRERSEHGTGLFCLLTDVEREHASGGLAETADEDDDEILRYLADSEVEGCEEDDFARKRQDERDEKRVDGDGHDRTDPVAVLTASSTPPNAPRTTPPVMEWESTVRISNTRIGPQSTDEKLSLK